jgi:hypothetical protein
MNTWMIHCTRKTCDFYVSVYMKVNVEFEELAADLVGLLYGSDFF